MQYLTYLSGWYPGGPIPLQQDKLGTIVDYPYMSQMSKQKDIQDKEDSRFILGLAGWARERKEECVSGVAQARGGPGGGAICPQDLGRGPVECVR